MSSASGGNSVTFVANFVFKQAAGKSELDGSFAVRRQVFISEQKIAREDEWDGLEDICLHFIAKQGKRIIGTARLRFPEPGYAKIERMAVLKSYRRLGVGAGILTLVEQAIKNRGLAEAELHAQITAAPFYLACGYREAGVHFYEAGIEHVKMVKKLENTKLPE